MSESLRTELWPIPALGIVIGLALGIGAARLDEVIDPKLPDGIAQYLFGGGADAARTLLGAVAGSLITVTSLTFSLTVVTLQLASGQFSPRLLRTFTRDRVVHATLALFLGTFTYALAVLRTVRTENGSDPAFVPQFAVTLAFVLCIASVMGLVLFLAHLASEIRVETMLRRVHRDAGETLRSVASSARRASNHVTSEAPDDAALLLVAESGFLLHVEEELILRLAHEHHCTISIDRTPGELLVEGTPIGRVWIDHTAPSPAVLEAVAVGVDRSVHIGFERTESQDVAYGLRQLADVSAKALSPGVNDPTTAIHGLGHIAALLCELSRHTLGPITLADDARDGQVRLARADFAALLETGIAQARRYGAGDSFVVIALLALLRDVGWCASTDEQRDAVRGQLERMRSTAAAQGFDDTEHARITDHARQVDEALNGIWHAAGSTT